MRQRFDRVLAIAMLVVSAGAMMSASFDVEARRFGGGASFGRQSSNITKQRQAVTPPAASTTQRASTPPAASTAATGAAAATTGAVAKSGLSRFIGPIAGIAAGLGIAALLSSLGLGGAFLEMLSSLVLIALVVFAFMFILRRLRGLPVSRPAEQGAGASLNQDAGSSGARGWSGQRPGRAAESATSAFESSGQTAATPSSSGSGFLGHGAPAHSDPHGATTLASTSYGTGNTTPPVDENWFIPADFDTPTFLATAKAQFVAIQAVWDSGDLGHLEEYLTDDLLAEFKPQILAREGKPETTEVLLLNAQLMGIESVAGGHLASVRYSGMLRESPDTEAFRFEEIWNLYKADGAGWLLAGIQQLPVDNAG
ncbi:MAG: Tim44 domain-containing protein [Burkholderiaceae bacterium]|nr:MAG: Tim44 domain-containing protein [Burkholderiaceae bacterium]TAM01467.1 MAG: Tim44 domain-containing protein [Pusillimonas sp.]